MAGYLKPIRKDFCIHCGRPFADLEAHKARIHTKDPTQEAPATPAAMQPGHGNIKRALAYTRLKESRNQVFKNILAFQEKTGCTWAAAAQEVTK